MKAKGLGFLVLILGLSWGLQVAWGEGLRIWEEIHFLGIQILLHSGLRWGIREEIVTSLRGRKELSDHLVLLYLEATGDNPKDREMLLRLLERYHPSSPVLLPAVVLCAERSQRENRPKEAFSFTLKALSLAQNEEDKLFILGKLFELLKDNHKNEALLLARKMYLDFPQQTLRETKEMLSDLLNVLLPEDFSLQSRIQVGEFLLSLGLLDEAQRFAESLKKEKLPVSLETPLFLLEARLFLRKGDLLSLKKLLEGRPETENVLYYRGILAQRNGLYREAIDLYERFLSAYPQSRYRESVLRNIAFSYEMLKDEEKRINTLRRATQAFPQNGVFLWDLFWALYQKGYLEEAKEILGKLEDIPERKNQAFFWQFKITGDEAFLWKILQRTYLDYYYVRASVLLRKKGEIPSPFKEGEEPTLSLPAVLQKHWAKYQFFSNIGLWNHAAIELSFLVLQNPKDPFLILEKTRFLAKTGEYRKSLSFAHHLMPREGEIPSFVGKQYYPLFFLEGVERAVKAKNPSLDPYLVLALMHAESTFDPGAISSARAMGLLQVIPSTGAWVLEKGWAQLEGDIRTLLLAPQTNIAIGVAYFSYLLERFNGDIILAICGYNAGPGRVASWQEVLPSDRDAFIESIPFPETQTYVKRVLTNYFAYSVLYRGINSFPDIF
ncbi:MAG: lytic transglycosylase domain-containing protein [Candidatus Caldatribacteriaceae bacterium]